MALDLSGVELKLDRAYAHVQALDAQIGAWANSDPYALRQEVSDDGREHTFTLLVHRPPESPSLGLLLGDAVHNFRAALDHLVFAIARDVLTEQDLADVEDVLAFPICTSREAWDAALARGRLTGLEGDVRARVHERQPYRTPDVGERFGGSLLLTLHWLNNRDKHRVLHTFAAFPEIRNMHFIPELPGPNEVRVTNPPYEHGTEVLWARTANPSPHVQMEAETVVQIRVQGSSLQEDVRVTLHKIGNAIRRIVSVVADAHSV